MYFSNPKNIGLKSLIKYKFQVGDLVEFFDELDSTFTSQSGSEKPVFPWRRRRKFDAWRQRNHSCQFGIYLGVHLQPKWHSNVKKYVKGSFVESHKVLWSDGSIEFLEVGDQIGEMLLKLGMESYNGGYLTLASKIQ